MSKKLRIVYFYQYFGTSKGGWSTRVYESCKRWVDAGHQVTVVTTPYDKSDIPKFKGLSKKFDYDGIEVIVLNFLQSNKDHKLKRMLRFVQFIVTGTFYVLKLKYNVAIASSGPITVGFLGLVAKKMRKKNFVFEVRDLWPAGSIELGIIKSKAVQKAAYWFEYQCYKNADLIVACSQGMKQDIVRRFSFRNILVVPNSCDTQLFSEKTQSAIPEQFQNKQLVLYTGSLGLMDHCMQIVKAAKFIDPAKYPDLRLVIIGDGTERQMMEDYVAAENLTHVYFLGLIPKTEVVAWMQHAICALVCFKNVPILNTVSPNKMFDAFAAGLPIVQTTQGWIKDLVANESCGINVLPDEPKQMADAIEEYLNNSQLRIRHGNNALRLAHSTFSRDNCAAQMLESITKLP
jgi:glycosyltransferase involved in cell wall biosynthesis